MVSLALVAREVVVAEAVVVLVVVILVREQALALQESDRSADRLVAELQRELALLAVLLRDRNGLELRRAILNVTVAAERLDHLLHPRDRRQAVRLLLRHVRDERELLVRRGQKHLADVAAAALRLLRRRVHRHVHVLEDELEKRRVAVRRLARGREELDAAHVRRTSDLGALLAALLRHLLRLALVVLGHVHGRDRPARGRRRLLLITGEVVVAEAVVVLVVVILVREQALALQESDRSADHLVAELQRELALLAVLLRDRNGLELRRAILNVTVAAERLDHLLHPRDRRQAVRLLLRHVRDERELLVRRRQNHLADVAAAALRLLRRSAERLDHL